MSAEPVLSGAENQAPVAAELPRVSYSMKEALKITGLGKTTLWEAISKGELKHFKVGRRTLFSLKHLEDYMALFESGNQSAAPVRRRKRKAEK